MGPTFNTAYINGIEPLMNEQISEEEAWPKILQPFAEFMKLNNPQL